jgi:drug/metabolite transporter (DMT)-like permease
MPHADRPAAWKLGLAFAVIYLVWGSTFLAIRIGVAEMPPFLMAGMRFLAAGAALVAWRAARGTPLPTAPQWQAAALLAVLIFVVNYGLVFWAEQRVNSGMTAIIMATIPAFTAISEILILGTQRMTARLAAALLVGALGVVVLTSRSLGLGGEVVDTVGAGALIVGAIGWSVASALAKKVKLPASKMMSSGAQMLVGGVMLLLAAALLGEFRGFEPAAVSTGAWLALLYLIVPGSIIAFTAYVWLIHHESPTRVGTYAYVNPLVAVLLGYAVADEGLGARTIVGSLCVLVSVIVITTLPQVVPAAAPARAPAPGRGADGRTDAA